MFKRLSLLMLISCVYVCSNAQKFYRIYDYQTTKEINQNKHIKQFYLKCFAGLSLNSKGNKRLISSSDSVVTILDKKIRLEINTSKNVCIDINEFGVTEELHIYLKHVDTLLINGGFGKKVFIYRGLENDSKIKAGSIGIDNVNLRIANFERAQIGSLVLKRSNVSFLNLRHAEVNNTFALDRIQLDGADFHNSLLPDHFSMESIDLTYVDDKIDFSTLRFRTLQNNNKLFLLEKKMYINNLDLDKFIIPYDRFNFGIQKSNDVARVNWVYEKLIKHLEEQKITSKLKYYMQEYNDIRDSRIHNRLTNWVNQKWWEKGRNKTLLVKNIAGLFAFFFLFNYIQFKWLRRLYFPKSIKVYFLRIEKKYWKYNNFQRGYIYSTSMPQGMGDFCKKLTYLLSRLFGVFVYTIYVFWGIKIDFSILKIKYPIVFTYIFTQYIFGIICIAYLLSIIILK